MQIASRLKVLEVHRAQQYGKTVRVIHRDVDKTNEQAIQREGVELSDELLAPHSGKKYD